jgi:hypothetical protein
MTDTTYKKFVKRWEEVTDLPPQTMGPATPCYKKLVARLKVMPWGILVLGSIIVVIGLYLLLGTAITAIVSILQRGF